MLIAGHGYMHIYIEIIALTGSQALQLMFLKCSHPKLNHDIESLMMALIAIEVTNSITI